MATKSYLIHYSGNLRANLSSIPGTAIIPLTPYIAAITIDEQYESQLSEINSISVLEPEIPYTVFNNPIHLFRFSLPFLH